MLIKSADVKDSEIAILQKLLVHDRVPPDKRILIEKELRNVIIGATTEKQAAFEIDFYAAPSKNLFVIHDLRLEVGGRVAQIDHVLMNRAFEMFVVETKTYSTGLTVNERGEFSTTYDGRQVGIPSPIEQNARHISVLKAAFEEVGLPKRLGVTMHPTYNSVVLVSPKAVINRPSPDNLGAAVIKLDQFFSWYHKKMDSLTAKDMVGILKVCSSDTVRDVVERLLALHKPKRVDYIKKFNLQAVLTGKDPVEPKFVQQQVVDPLMSTVRKTETEYFCADCKSVIATVVAKFCWNNKAKFGGKAFCRACQLKVQPRQAYA